jgi:hypothetical protein
MIALYRSIVEADLDAVDWATAELVKTVENAYRDVQIAFANEVALICEQAGADVFLVRELVNKSPFRSMHIPGAGVGGHCIPKDPWLLAYGIEGSDVPLRLIPAARLINDQVVDFPHLFSRIAGYELTIDEFAPLEHGTCLPELDDSQLVEDHNHNDHHHDQRSKRPPYRSPRAIGHPRHGCSLPFVVHSKLEPRSDCSRPQQIPVYPRTAQESNRAAIGRTEAFGCPTGPE